MGQHMQIGAAFGLTGLPGNEILFKKCNKYIIHEKEKPFTRLPISCAL